MTPRRSSVIRRWLPPQHGAWAMLAVPLVVGATLAGWRWVHALLAVAWVSGYMWSWFAQLAVKTRSLKPRRRQVMVYGVMAAVAGLGVVVIEPAVVWFAVPFAVLGAVSTWYARQRNDRSFVNDGVLVAMAALMVPLAALVGREGISAQVWAATGWVFAYFVGTVLYVKTMIRERNNARVLRASIGFHVVVAAAALAAAVGIVPWGGLWLLAVVFTWCAVRSIWFPRLGLRPAQVGAVEIVTSAGLVVALVI